MAIHGSALLGDHDLHLLNEGTHRRLWEKLGSHTGAVDGKEGTHFAVWAPNAQRVSVMGDWGGWKARPEDALAPIGNSGVWAGFLPGIGVGALYKYEIVSNNQGQRFEKADPFATRTETPPGTASVVWDLSYTWNDGDWMGARAGRNVRSAPISIYEMHLASWRKGRTLSHERADELADYLHDMGFTHLELLPVMEHPFYGSWGYQTTGYFAPSARFGSPQDLMHLVDRLHQRGIGIILDWVPSHFPSDGHGLAYFDGTHLFEHEDPRKGFHPDWNSLIFNYGRNEVRAFLLSSALYWLDVFHADGLRVDAVASMLYLDYSRKEGEWIPNKYGGRENLEAIDFLQQLNTAVFAEKPDVQTFAEESTAYPKVSQPVYNGGLGFGFKWDMGWMHDTLQYMTRDPIHRRYHHGELTFRAVYAFSENFVMPLSHDEVVHGKGSLIGKMPGDEWQKLGNLRLLLGSMWTQPGKKLLFMGGELGQYREWDHEGELEWALQDRPGHAGIQRFVRDLNTLYRAEPALHARDCEPEGFAWLECNDDSGSSLAFLRKGFEPEQVAVVAFNFTPTPRANYRIGVPFEGVWTEALNSDAPLYGGSGQGNLGRVETTPVGAHGHAHSVNVTLPPLGMLVLTPEAPEA